MTLLDQTQKEIAAAAPASLDNVPDHGRQARHCASVDRVREVSTLGVQILNGADEGLQSQSAAVRDQEAEQPKF
jgi:hypothetical protein